MSARPTDLTKTEPRAPINQVHDLASQHLANERTHLSYLRTAIALISFGITVNRFSLWLIENSRLPTGRPVFPLFQAEQVGFGMVVLGMAMLVWSTARYSRVSREIESATYRGASTATMWVMAGAILLFSLPALVWLFQR